MGTGRFKNYILSLLLILFIGRCNKDLESIEVVYQNDFEALDLNGIKNGIIFPFNGTNVLGNYHGGGFTLNLENLDDHDFVIISMDLYIHDAWDGNSVGVDGPDFWFMEVDDWIRFGIETSKNKIFKTTFSNSVCNTILCRLQSYPDQYPTSNFPRASVDQMNLPGLCHWSNRSDGTSLYQITRSFSHKGSALSMQVYDRLVQSNVPDPACDESWSVDNLIVELAKFD